MSGAPHGPCRWFAPALPLYHVGDATLRHGGGLGHLVLHGASHTCQQVRVQQEGTHTQTLSKLFLAFLVDHTSSQGEKNENVEERGEVDVLG